MDLATLPRPATAFASEPAPRLKLALRGIAKDYVGVVALQPVELDVVEGELLTVLGPSGSGKTTLLQIVCGLVEPSAGRLFIDGRDHTKTPVSARDVGVVFQNYALFPHLTVEENVAFPLRMRNRPAADIAREVRHALHMVDLDQLAARFPSELSGGQQQRVALARCFVYRPRLILMDEPLGALDRKLRERMQLEIKRLHRETGTTIIFVTHDQEEALALSDRVCLMNNARIEQIGTPQDIYERPASMFAASFIGISNLVSGTVAAGMLDTAHGSFPLPADAGAQTGDRGSLCLRPEHLTLTTTHAGRTNGVVTESIFAGSETRLLVQLTDGTTLTVRQPAGRTAIELGTTVGVDWAPDRACFLMH